MLSVICMCVTTLFARGAWQSDQRRPCIEKRTARIPVLLSWGRRLIVSLAENSIPKSEIPVKVITRAVQFLTAFLRFPGNALNISMWKYSDWDSTEARNFAAHFPAVSLVRDLWKTSKKLKPCFSSLTISCMDICGSLEHAYMSQMQTERLLNIISFIYLFPISMLYLYI